MTIINLINRHRLLFLILLAILIRSLIGWVAYQKNVMTYFEDDLAYMNFAENILEQGPMVLDTHKLDITAQVVGPGLPWLMAMFKKIFGDGWLMIFLVNAIISSVICILIFLLARIIFDYTVGLWASLWSVIYVLFLKYIPTAGKEIWMTFLFTLVVLFVIKNEKKDYETRFKYLNVFVMSGIFSLLIHMDERYFMYFPLVLFFLIFLNNNGWKKGLTKGFIFVFLVLLLMVPWFIRNYIVYQKPVLLSLRTARFTDKILGYKEEQYFVPVEQKWYLDDEQIQKAISGEKVKMKNDKSIRKNQLDAMKDGIIPHRFSRLEGYWSVFQILWKPVDFNRSYSTTGYRYDGVWSWRHNISVGLTYGLLLPFMFWGFVGLYRQKRKIAIFLGSILVYHSLIHMIFIPFTRNRYRISIDVIVIVLGVYGMTEFFKWVKYKLIRSSTH